MVGLIPLEVLDRVGTNVLKLIFRISWLELMHIHSPFPRSFRQKGKSLTGLLHPIHN